MDTPYVGDAGVFLIRTVFGLYILAVMLRFLLALARADFYNPVSQFLVKITNPAVIPLRRLVPGVGGLDSASLILLLVLQMLEIWLSSRIQGYAPGILGLAVLATGELLNLVKNIFLFSILIQVILSWVNPGTYHPASALLYRLNEPLLGPARRMIPPMGGFDLSPIVILVGLQLAAILVIAPISDLGWRLALR